MITLTQDEIREITALVRPSAQARWFKMRYGIDAERRADGSLSVPRQLYYQKAGVKQSRPEPQLRFNHGP